jgi:hypothetical protein
MALAALAAMKQSSGTSVPVPFRVILFSLLSCTVDRDFIDCFTPKNLDDYFRAKRILQHNELKRADCVPGAKDLCCERYVFAWVQDMSVRLALICAFWFLYVYVCVCMCVFVLAQKQYGLPMGYGLLYSGGDMWQHKTTDTLLIAKVLVGRSVAIPALPLELPELHRVLQDEDVDTVVDDVDNPTILQVPSADRVLPLVAICF